MREDNPSVCFMNPFHAIVNKCLRRSDIGRSLHRGNVLFYKHLRKIHFHLQITVGKHINHIRLPTKRTFNLVDFHFYYIQAHAAGAVGTHTARLPQRNDHITGGDAVCHGTAVKRIF